MRYASRIQQIAGKASNSWDAHVIAKQKRARGEAAILMTVGDTDFASPTSAIAAVHESLAAGRTCYTPSAGGLPMREAVARHHAHQTGQVIHPDQVVVTVGAQNALLTAALCLIEPGDQVLVPEPMYLTYPGTIAAAGGVIVSVRSPAINRFHPLITELEAAIGPRTRAIFLATPNNPTGAVYTTEELSGIAALCQKHDLWLVSDEVYGDLVYEGRHVSPCILPGMSTRTITINSLSKSHAMAGWRLGWMVAPQKFAEYAGQVTYCSTYGIPTFLQDAAVVALEQFPDGLPELRAAYRRRRDRFCDWLGSVRHFSCFRPEGGMFVMLDIRASGLSAYDFAMGLVVEEGVATLPADDFGESAKGHLRINLGVVDAEIDEAAMRLIRYAERLGRHRASY
ncbi:pyridoxal phosphate-dependent aminotransferase [Bradyrhizobium yuanmingense]|uniref:pyridoxal phosphate-dependent aminotransferase n=1 Tax=Bradyrhizobium yuanmingense TaxID=108015 RepID=UPI0023B98034|nr:pyridoxal phosphate-dependent aminotransferase [Bradyrhizobium yuanmingense]MDF0581973.1 pyridoxal phosphate-dependent aminotransferase [Bradyrhizobium yuanmingense]